MIDPNKPLWQLTVAEFLELQNKQELPVIVKDTTNEKYVYGIAGIEKIFGCSKSTANRIKQSGIIDKAISQTGRTIVIDSELALKLYKLKN